MRGFTLAELMVCLGIIVLSLLAMLAAQVFGMRANTGTRHRHTASMAAGSVMAQAEQRLRDDFGDSLDMGRTAMPDYPGYEYALEQSDEMGGALKRLDLSVYWTDEHGAQEYRMWTKVLEE